MFFVFSSLGISRIVGSIVSPYYDDYAENSFRPIPMHPPPYFQEENYIPYRLYPTYQKNKAQEENYIPYRLYPTYQKNIVQEENFPFRPIPIHPPLYFQEANHRWMKLKPICERKLQNSPIYWPRRDPMLRPPMI